MFPRMPFEYFCSLGSRLDFSLIIDTGIDTFTYDLPEILVQIIACMLTS